MLEKSDLPEAMSRLREMIDDVTGGYRNVTIGLGHRRMILTRMALLEVLSADDPPSRDGFEASVVATAQRLGSDETPARQDDRRGSVRMSIDVPLDRFQVVPSGESIWRERPPRRSRANKHTAVGSENVSALRSAERIDHV